MSTPDSPLAAPTPTQSEPLTKAQHAMVRDAVIRRKIVRRSAAVARSSAVVMLAIGAAALIATIFMPSWQSYLVSAGLCAVGIIEYRGSSRLRLADAQATRTLGINQLALLALIIIYCAVQMATFSSKDFKNTAISSEVRSQLSALPDMQKNIDKTIDDWAPLAIYGFYGLVILLSGICQGGMAGYYFTRKKHIDSFNQQTPQWIKRLLAQTDA